MIEFDAALLRFVTTDFVVIESLVVIAVSRLDSFSLTSKKAKGQPQIVAVAVIRVARRLSPDVWCRSWWAKESY